MEHSQQSIDFVRSEYDNIFIPDERLMPLCARKAGRFLPAGDTATRHLCDQITAALRDGKPLSVVRVGDAEGNAISLTKPALNALQVMGLYNKFQQQNGAAIPLPDLIDFCRTVKEALISGDVIGFRAFRGNEQSTITSQIERRQLFAAMGVLYARELLQQGIEQDDWRAATLTNAWIYFDIAPRIVDLAEAAAKVIVISGRAELRDEFARRLDGRLEEFIEVPVQWSTPTTPELSHFACAFPAVRRRLAADLKGKLVLVGAGLFGKVYCHTARQNGGVAIDLGSGFDILAGRETRPVHAGFDIDAMRWV